MPLPTDVAGAEGGFAAQVPADLLHEIEVRNAIQDTLGNRMFHVSRAWTDGTMRCTMHKSSGANSNSSALPTTSNTSQSAVARRGRRHCCRVSEVVTMRGTCAGRSYIDSDIHSAVCLTRRKSSGWVPRWVIFGSFPMMPARTRVSNSSRCNSGAIRITGNPCPLWELDAGKSGSAPGTASSGCFT